MEEREAKVGDLLVLTILKNRVISRIGTARTRYTVAASAARLYPTTPARCLTSGPFPFSLLP